MVSWDCFCAHEPLLKYTQGVVLVVVALSELCKVPWEAVECRWPNSVYLFHFIPIFTPPAPF